MCCVLTLIFHKFSFFHVFSYVVSYHIHSNWFPFTIKWRILRLRKETASRDVVCCEYIR